MKLLSHRLFFSQAIAHLSIIPMVCLGRPIHYVIAVGVYFLIGCFGMSITYHRLIAHKSFDCRPFFKFLGLFLGSIGLTGSALGWCAVHREHHVAPDTTKDPHSPKHKGFLWVEFASMFHVPQSKFVRPLLRDKMVVFFHRNYFKINLLFGLMLLAIDPLAIVYAYLFPAALVWHGGSLINSLGHLWGYRNYDTHDQSRNNPIFGYLMWGEGWHNNHHKNPAKVNFKVRWFEFDVSHFFIRYVFSRDVI